MSSATFAISILPRKPSAPAASARTHTVRQAPTAVAKRTRRAQNAPGNFYVDTSCIDCDTCRWLAPDTFHRDGHMSAVHTQPQTEASELQALRAAAACPTGSIRTQIPNKRAAEANASFPLPVEDSLVETPVPDVFYNGFASPKTFGGSSWLLLHRGSDPHAIMFDCPRFFGPLAKRIKDLAKDVGGVRYLVLSHQDDVAGHDKWAEALGAKRVIHKDECNSWQGTDVCEVQLTNNDFPYELSEGSQLIHVPGHSLGSIALLHQPTESLFTGDHIMFRRSVGKVSGGGFSQSVPLQTVSVEKLSDVPFRHGWPGHGGHFHFESAEERRQVIADAVKFMRAL